MSPGGGETAVRRLARREELLDAALAALAAVGPEVTMTRMAAEAGVTKPILYRYFGDRAGLQGAIAARFATGLREELARAGTREMSPRESLAAGIDAYLTYLERQPEVYRFLTRRLPTEAAHGQEMVSGFVHGMAAEVAAALAVRLGEAGTDVADAELLGFGVTGMVQLAGELWLERRDRPRAHVVAVLTGVLWEGLSRMGSTRLPGVTYSPTSRGERAVDPAQEGELDGST